MKRTIADMKNEKEWYLRIMKEKHEERENICLHPSDDDILDASIVVSSLSGININIKRWCNCCGYHMIKCSNICLLCDKLFNGCENVNEDSSLLCFAILTTNFRPVTFIKLCNYAYIENRSITYNKIRLIQKNINSACLTKGRIGYLNKEAKKYEKDTFNLYLLVRYIISYNNCDDLVNRITKIVLFDNKNYFSYKFKLFV